MKKQMSLFVILFTLLFVLMACSDDQANSVPDSPEMHDEDDADSEAEKNSDTGAMAEMEADNDEEPLSDDRKADDAHRQTADDGKGVSTLSAYSSEEIEYARVWLQLGPHQDIDGLYAEKISAGEPMNPNDATSLDYPEDVVQLSGARLVDGAVTYSSNGDGTVNIYQVPKRWDGKNPAGEDVYRKIVDSTEHVSIEPGDDQEVEGVIKKLHIQ